MLRSDSPYAHPYIMALSTINPGIKENLTSKIIFMTTPSRFKEVESDVKATKESRSEIMRRALDFYYTYRDKIEDFEKEPSDFSAPFLNGVPCGPWAQAIDTARTINISSDTADEIEAQPGDVWVRAVGHSMEGRGVLDGSLVLVRPYGERSPRRSEIVLVQVQNAEGEYVGTLKEFDGFFPNGQTPILLDGNGEHFSFPVGTGQIKVIGRAIATVSRL